MANRKRKTLPKDFESLLEEADIEKLKTVFDRCDVNAYGGTLKYTALGFNECPDELARWLIDRGADLAASNHYGETALHARAGHWQGRIDVLLELGADVNITDQRGNTPLHDAASVGHIGNAELLLNHGADAGVQNDAGLTPLAYALQRCSNTKIAQIADMAELLLDKQADKRPETIGFVARIFGGRKRVNPSITEQMKECIRRIGTEFEFHRANFNPDMLDVQSEGLEKLYALFNVLPIPKRAMHDGKSAITATAKGLAEQHQELWELLVPSSGPAETLQGEVIRISGRITDELERNDGVNWNKDYRKMDDAYLSYVKMGKPLTGDSLEEATTIISGLRKQESYPVQLCELAVEWVALNPRPLKLPTPKYNR